MKYIVLQQIHNKEEYKNRTGKFIASILKYTCPLNSYLFLSLTALSIIFSFDKMYS